MRGFLTFITVIVVLVAVGLGAAYFFLTQPSDVAVAATPIPTSAAAVDSFDNKVGTLVAAPRTMATTIELTDAELTSKMAQLIAVEQSRYGADVQNVQVASRDGRVYVGGNVKTNDIPLRVNLTIIAVPEARNGRLHLRVERVDAGRFPVPDTLRAQIVGLIENDDAINSGLPITAERVEAQTGRLLLTGRPK